MLELEKTIVNEEGLHARPALKLVDTAKQFQSDIKVSDLSTGKSGNAKSILSMLSLCATKGHRIKIHVSGADESDAILALSQLIENNFSTEA